MRTLQQKIPSRALDLVSLKACAPCRSDAARLRPRMRYSVYSMNAAYRDSSSAPRADVVGSAAHAQIPAQGYGAAELEWTVQFEPTGLGYAEYTRRAVATQRSDSPCMGGVPRACLCVHACAFVRLCACGDGRKIGFCGGGGSGDGVSV